MCSDDTVFKSQNIYTKYFSLSPFFLHKKIINISMSNDKITITCM